jgi:hypothetical protein
MLPPRRALASRLPMSWLLALLLVAAAPVAGQAKRAVKVEPVRVLHAFALKHQPATEGLDLVRQMLSPIGTVELEQGGDTLVIRDSQAALDRILPVLRSFDHPVRPLRVEIFIVRASRDATSPAMERSDLPEPLTRRLRKLLPYEVYQVQAQAQTGTREGEKVNFELSDEYRVSFRIGTVMADGRIKLNDFRINRQDPRPVNLIHTHLNLWLDQTMSLGLANSEESMEALMVVLTLRGGDGSRKRAIRSQ